MHPTLTARFDWKFCVYLKVLVTKSLSNYSTQTQPNQFKPKLSSPRLTTIPTSKCLNKFSNKFRMRYLNRFRRNRNKFKLTANCNNRSRIRCQSKHMYQKVRWITSMKTSSKAHSKTNLLPRRCPTNTASQALKRGRFLICRKKIQNSKLIGILTHGLEVMHFLQTCNSKLNQFNKKKRKALLIFLDKKSNRLSHSQISQVHSLTTWMD